MLWSGLFSATYTSSKCRSESIRKYVIQYLSYSLHEICFKVLSLSTYHKSAYANFSFKHSTNVFDFYRLMISSSWAVKFLFSYSRLLFHWLHTLAIQSPCTTQDYCFYTGLLEITLGTSGLYCLLSPFLCTLPRPTCLAVQWRLK